MGRVGFKVRGLAAAGLAAAAIGSGIAVAPAADAAPRNCRLNYSSTGANARCDYGSGWYQVYISCKQNYWPYGWAFREGPWYYVGSGQTSWAFCPWTYDLQYANVGIRN